MKKLFLLMVAFVTVFSLGAFAPLKNQQQQLYVKKLPPVGYYVGTVTISTGGDRDGTYSLYSLPNNHSFLTYGIDENGANVIISGTFDVNQSFASFSFDADPTHTVYSGYVVVNP